MTMDFNKVHYMIAVAELKSFPKLRRSVLSLSRR